MTTKYGTPFGNQTTPQMTVFVFPDFNLTYVKRIELTEEERRRKQIATAAGIDGGDSMLAPSNRFRVDSRQGETLQEFDLRMLPYAREIFEIKKSKFTLKNSLSAAGVWTVEPNE